MTEDNAEEELVAEVLDEDRPPTASLGTTTDYEQVALAWARSHGLTLDQFLTRLDEKGGAEGKTLASEVRADPEKQAAFKLALQEALTGSAPPSPDDAPAETVS